MRDYFEAGLKFCAGCPERVRRPGNTQSTLAIVVEIGELRRVGDGPVAALAARVDGDEGEKGGYDAGGYNWGMMSRKIAAVLAATALTLAAADGLMRVDSVPESKIMHKAAPVYPPAALDARVEGTVKVALMIGKDGHVLQAHLVSGHPLLAQAGLQAAKKYIFEPFERDGQPVRAVTQIEIPFSLANTQ
jgi:TonB family protein